MKAISIKKEWHNLFESFMNVTDEKYGKWFGEGIYWDAPKGTLVATCGKCLLLSTDPKLKEILGEESGFYTYQKGILLEKEIPNGEVYPKYSRVVPDYSKWNRNDFKGYEGASKKWQGMRLLSQTSAYSGRVFDPSLFSFIEKIAPFFCSVYHKGSGWVPVVLTDVSESILYVVMPFATNV